MVGLGPFCTLGTGRSCPTQKLNAAHTPGSALSFELYSMAVAVRPGSLRSPYTYPTVIATMNCIDRIFEEGNVPPGRGVPYAPLAWDPLFVPQPIELAAAVRSEK